jgi:hypothetical protein
MQSFLAISFENHLLKLNKMKKTLLIVPIFTCIFVFYLPAQETNSVLAFLDITTIGTEESKGKIVYNYILDPINKSGNYIIVERGELDRALQEIEFSSSDLVDDSTAVEIGKLTGAEAVLISPWTKEEEKFYLSLRVIDIQTAQVTITSKNRQTPSTRWNRSPERPWTRDSPSPSPSVFCGRCLDSATIRR